MSILNLSYFIAGAFGLFLFLQYTIFLVVLSGNNEKKAVKADQFFIALIGLSVAAISLVSLFPLFIPHINMIIVHKIRIFISILIFVVYIFLLKNILMMIKDLTFVETDNFKDNSKKHMIIFLSSAVIILVLFIFTPFCFQTNPTFHYTLIAFIFPFFLLLGGIFETSEFLNIIHKERGKLSTLNYKRFKTILLLGAFTGFCGIVEISLMILFGINILEKTGSIFMYASVVMTLGLSLNLLFEHIEAMNHIRESNKKLSDLNKKIMDEVRTAQSLQISLLPIDKQREIQKILDMEISYMPMQSVGGDYYDFYNLDNNNILMLLGDASGHGVYAAMIWAMLKVEVEELIEEKAFSNLADAFSILNKRITRILENTYSYATLFSCVLNLKDHTLSFISAGHTDQLYYSQSQNSVLRLRNKNPIIGTFKNAKFSTDAITGDKGDILFLFTDGVPEGVDQKNEQLGNERLQNLFLESCKGAKDASHILNNILSELEEFSEGAMQHDDRTIMIIRF